MTTAHKEIVKSNNYSTVTTKMFIDDHLHQTSLCENPAAEIKLAIYYLEKVPRVYHTAVLVYGKEFHYGIKTGILICEPMNNDLPLEPRIMLRMRWKFKFLKYLTFRNYHLYTTKSFKEVMTACEVLQAQLFNKRSFHLICRNCIDFSKSFIAAIADGGPIPFRWPQELRQPLITFILRPVLRQVGAGRPSAARLVQSANKNGSYADEKKKMKKINKESE